MRYPDYHSSKSLLNKMPKRTDAPIVKARFSISLSFLARYFSYCSLVILPFLYIANIYSFVSSSLACWFSTFVALASSAFCNSFNSLYSLVFFTINFYFIHIIYYLIFIVFHPILIAYAKKLEEFCMFKRTAYQWFHFRILIPKK